MSKNIESKNIRCSFCGLPQESVKKIIAGPGVYICNECIGLCNDIIENEYYDIHGNPDGPAGPEFGADPYGGHRARTLHAQSGERTFSRNTYRGTALPGMCERGPGKEAFTADTAILSAS